MPKGYSDHKKDCTDEALDELFCEYVDGTMDPKVMEAFEELLLANPDLAAQARCLCEMRQLLCTHGCREAPQGLQFRIHQRVAREIARRASKRKKVVEKGLGSAATLTSTLGLVLILGMVAGLVVLEQGRVSGADATADDTYEVSTRDRAPADTPGLLRGSIPLESLLRSPEFPVAGPVTALPVVSHPGAMTPAGWMLAADSSLLRVSVSGLAP